ncbi:SRPBCC domain-containing protein [Niabella aurantiaca]|uniref:SRPBCC domain-containing protein n=1 Tax=Niabella aurantiaca TaxID=379900 RepID=UPI0005937D30|nr:SRPBCC domain-containing protein [Niabella aurantiaca]
MDTQPAMIHVEVTVHQPAAVVWEAWTTPAAIAQWNRPFDHWWVPKVKMELREGGAFCYRMEARDGSEGFDHKGVYDRVIPMEQIAYTLADGRKSLICFSGTGDTTAVIEQFEPGAGLEEALQRDFCQAVLNRFKAYTENIKSRK